MKDFILSSKADISESSHPRLRSHCFPIGDIARCPNNCNCNSTVKRILYEVADLVLIRGEAAAREQYRAILQIADGVAIHSSDHSRAPPKVPHVCTATDDLVFLREAGGDLREKINQIRSSVRSIESRSSSELDRYKQLALRNEAKLIAERNLNKRLRAQLERTTGSRNPTLTSRSLSRYSHMSEPEEYRNRPGLGALTVRSMNSARPFSPRNHKNHQH